MNPEQTIRAWKDADYRLSLGEAEVATLLPHPSGLIELSDLDIGRVGGGEEAVTPSLILASVIAIAIPVYSVLLSMVGASVAQGGTCKMGGLGCPG